MLMALKLFEGRYHTKEQYSIGFLATLQNPQKRIQSIRLNRIVSLVHNVAFEHWIASLPNKIESVKRVNATMKHADGESEWEKERAKHLKWIIFRVFAASMRTFVHCKFCTYFSCHFGLVVNLEKKEHRKENQFPCSFTYKYNMNSNKRSDDEWGKKMTSKMMMSMSYTVSEQKPKTSRNNEIL